MKTGGLTPVIINAICLVICASFFVEGIANDGNKWWVIMCAIGAVSSTVNAVLCLKKYLKVLKGDGEK